MMPRLTRRLPAALLLLAAAAACGTEQIVDPVLPDSQLVSRFRVLNFLTDERADTVAVRVAGQPYAPALPFRPGDTTAAATPDYAFILDGERVISATARNGGAVLLSDTLTITTERPFRTILLAGEGDTTSTIVLDDVLGLPNQQQYRIRLVHAAEDAGPVDVYALANPANFPFAGAAASDVQFTGVYALNRPLGQPTTIAVTPAGSKARILYSVTLNPSAGATALTTVLTDDERDDAAAGAVVATTIDP